MLCFFSISYLKLNITRFNISIYNYFFVKIIYFSLYQSTYFMRFFS